MKKALILLILFFVALFTMSEAFGNHQEYYQMDIIDGYSEMMYHGENPPSEMGFCWFEPPPMYYDCDQLEVSWSGQSPTYMVILDPIVYHASAGPDQDYRVTEAATAFGWSAIDVGFLYEEPDEPDPPYKVYQPAVVLSPAVMQMVVVDEVSVLTFNGRVPPEALNICRHLAFSPWYQCSFDAVTWTPDPVWSWLVSEDIYFVGAGVRDYLVSAEASELGWTVTEISDGFVR